MATTESIPMEVDCHEVKRRLEQQQEFLFLDCREPEERLAARIAGSKLIPMSELEQRINEVEPHRQGLIVIYCHHGGRSLHLAKWLRGQGFSKAQSMAGGIDQWSEQIDASVPRC